jgi:site-specific recombinase XerC
LVGCEIAIAHDPYLELSEYIEELPRQIVIDGINAIATERGGDFAKYRDSLIREVLSGRGRTLTNIRARLTRMSLTNEKPWVIANRLKREQGEKLSAALRASGYENIFDYLKNKEHIV